jgi:hypothetical protein
VAIWNYSVGRDNQTRHFATYQDLSALAAICSTERVWRYAASLAGSAAKYRLAYIS